MNFKAPTAIQCEAIPWALAGRDVIGLAETGSGKTAAFGLPVLNRLLDAPQPLFGLIISPTRELALQIGEQLEALDFLNEQPYEKEAVDASSGASRPESAELM